MGDALIAPLLAAILAIAPAVAGPASPAPAPVPAATEHPLREIGHVRATTTFCKVALERAVSGINVVLDNDAQASRVEFVLQRVDLDTSELVKFLNNGDLNKRYVALRHSAVTGNGILKELKTMAAQAPTEEQRTALISFANALDGALARQKRLADVIGRFVAYIDSHEPLSSDDHDALVFQAIKSQNDFYGPKPAAGPLTLVPNTLSDTAKQAAADLESRQPPITADENDAAQKIDPAFAAC